MRTIKLRDSVLLWSYPNRCHVTERLLPNHATLLQFRKFLKPSRGRDSRSHFFAPDLNPRLIGVNVFEDKVTRQPYGVNEIIFCYANAKAV